MLNSTFDILSYELSKSLYQSVLMISISLILSIIIGIILCVLLFLTKKGSFYQNKYIYSFLSSLVNFIRSVPFIILIIFCLPLTYFILNTKIGPIAACVPLTICAGAFLARLIESAFIEVDKGVIEAAIAQGASVKLIIKDVLLVEALPSIVRAITLTTISLISFSAMAGLVGGGGIGDLAIRYGYYRYETGVMLFTILLMVLWVQLAQFIGDFIARKLTH